MRRRIEDFYSRLLHRLYRRTKQRAAEGTLPLLVCFPDQPVNKETIPNEGIHWHGILTFRSLEIDNRRIKQSFGNFYFQNTEVFVGLHKDGQRDILRTIDVVPSHVSDNTISYAAKSIRFGRFSFSDVILLPKAKSEHYNE